MGRWLLSVGLLLGLLALGITLELCSEALLLPIAQGLEQASSQEDRQAALVREADRDWSQRQRLLAAFYHHAPLEEIDLQLHRLTREPSAEACLQLARLLRSLAASQRPSWENIF